MLVAIGVCVLGIPGIVYARGIAAIAGAVAVIMKPLVRR